MNKCWGACCGMFAVLGILGCDSEPLFDTTDEPSGGAMVVRTTQEDPAAATVTPTTNETSNERTTTSSESRAPDEEPRLEWEGITPLEIPAHWPAPFANKILCEVELLDIMSTVVDDASAQAAAPRLERLTDKSRGVWKRSWQWLALNSGPQVSYDGSLPVGRVEKLENEAKELVKGRYPEIHPLYTLEEFVRRPGNEAFRAAFLRYHDQIADESPPIPAESIRQQLKPLR